MGNGSEPHFSFGPKMLDSAIHPAIIAFFAAHAPAQVAELVDALGSGPSGGNTVEVRVLSWAPRFKFEEVRKTPSILVITGFFVFSRSGLPGYWGERRARRRHAVQLVRVFCIASWAEGRCSLEPAGSFPGKASLTDLTDCETKTAGSGNRRGFCPRSIGEPVPAHSTSPRWPDHGILHSGPAGRDGHAPGCLSAPAGRFYIPSFSRRSRAARDLLPADVLAPIPVEALRAAPAVPSNQALPFPYFPKSIGSSDRSQGPPDRRILTAISGLDNSGQGGEARARQRSFPRSDGPRSRAPSSATTGRAKCTSLRGSTRLPHVRSRVPAEAHDR